MQLLLVIAQDSQPHLSADSVRSRTAATTASDYATKGCICLLSVILLIGLRGAVLGAAASAASRATTWTTATTALTSPQTPITPALNRRAPSLCPLLWPLRCRGGPNWAFTFGYVSSIREDVLVAVQLSYHSDWCSRDYVKRGTCDATCKRCTPCGNLVGNPAAPPAGGPSSAPGSPSSTATIGAAPGPAPSSGSDTTGHADSSGETGTSGAPPSAAPAGGPGSPAAPGPAPAGSPGGIVKVTSGSSSSFCLAEIRVSPVEAPV